MMQMITKTTVTYIVSYNIFSFGQIFQQVQQIKKKDPMFSQKTKCTKPQKNLSKRLQKYDINYHMSDHMVHKLFYVLDFFRLLSEPTLTIQNQFVLKCHSHSQK